MLAGEMHDALGPDLEGRSPVFPLGLGGENTCWTCRVWAPHVALWRRIALCFTQTRVLIVELLRLGDAGMRTVW